MKNDTEKEQTKSQTVLIEQTGKKWKGLKLVGVLVFIIGSVIFIVSPSGFTVLFPLAGIAFYLWGRFGGWWHHG